MDFLPLLQATPNTTDHLILGLAIVIGLPVIYLFISYVRRRNALRDLEMIETLAAEDKKRRDTAGPASSSASRPADKAS